MASSTARLLARRRHDLHQPHSQCIVGAPVLAAKHVVHRVAPAGFTDKAHSGAAARERGRGDFALVEDRILCRDPNVGGQKQLVCDARHMPLNRDDERLRTLWPRGRNRIDELLRRLEWPVAQRGPPRRLIEALRKIRALAVQHGHPEVIVMLELVIGLADCCKGRDIDPVLRVDAIDADRQYALGRTVEHDRRSDGCRSRCRRRRRLRLGQRRAGCQPDRGGSACQHKNTSPPEASI